MTSTNLKQKKLEQLNLHMLGLRTHSSLSLTAFYCIKLPSSDNHNLSWHLVPGFPSSWPIKWWDKWIKTRMYMCYGIMTKGTCLIPFVRVTRRWLNRVVANFKWLKDPWLWKQNVQRSRKVKGTDVLLGKLVNKYGSGRS